RLRRGLGARAAEGLDGARGIRQVVRARLPRGRGTADLDERRLASRRRARRRLLRLAPGRARRPGASLTWGVPRPPSWRSPPRRGRGDGAGARGTFAAALRTLLGAGLLAGAAVAAASGPIARLLAPGFDAAAAQTTARLLRVLLGYGLLTSLALLASAALLAA